MFEYSVRRLLQAIPAIIGVTLVVFLLLHSSGGTAEIMLGTDATPEEIAAFREAYGLNRPLYVQYWQFVTHAIRGDFGMSIGHAKPAAEVVIHFLPNTLTLGVLATILSMAVGIPAGILAGIRRNSVFDYVVMIGAVLGQSITRFWLGLMLMLVFAAKLHWLPSAGIGEGITEQLRHIILPAITLTPWFLALVARLSRSGMLEVMRQDYIRTAYAKGLPSKIVLTRHAMRNALIPLVTATGLHMGWLFGGALIVEVVFAWPGVGFLAYRSVLDRDYPVVLCVVTMVAAAFITINLLVDILVAYIDPRVRLRKTGESQ